MKISLIFNSKKKKQMKTQEEGIKDKGRMNKVEKKNAISN